jgi:hypothetical protein
MEHSPPSGGEAEGSDNSATKEGGERGGENMGEGGMGSGGSGGIGEGGEGGKGKGGRGGQALLDIQGKSQKSEKHNESFTEHTYKL